MRSRFGGLRPLGLLALWLAATLGLRPLLLPDEGRYAGVAREMLQGDGLVPLLNGLPFFHKPPLLYWLDMAAMSLLGAGEWATQWAARFGPALLAWVLGAALFVHLRRWHGAAVARAGLLVLATAPLFFVGAQYVNHDMGVAGCITLAVLLLVRAVDDPAHTSLRWLMLGWAACGLGVLAKGLIGVVLPALVIGPWLLAQGRWRQMLSLLHPVAVAVGAAVALPWMLLMQQRHPGFFDYFIVEQHFRRYAGAAFNNVNGPWFYPVLLLALMLPWTAWLWPALRRAWATRVQDGARSGLYAWWVLAIVGFFSLPSSKLVGYVLPALAPLAALLALLLVERPRVLKWAGSGAALVCVAVVVALAWRAPGSNRQLANALAAQMAPGDRVVFVEQYFYDIPVYARLKEPVVVVSNWADPQLPLHDDWRKELFDAARFDPERGAKLLWQPERLSELLCHAGTVWFVAPDDRVEGLRALPGLVPVAAHGRAQLLRAPGRDCAAAAQ